MKFNRGKMYIAVLGLAALGAVHPPCPSIAAELQFTSDSIARGYERDKTTKKDILVAPLYEYLQVDYGALSEAGWSLHANGWGRTDVGDRDFFVDSDTGEADNETGELLHGYLEYTSESHNFSTRLGRQYIFEGPAGESIDGVRLQGEIGPIGISGFAGLPVALDEDNGNSGDEAYGSTLRFKLPEFNSLGLSYKKIVSDSDRDEEAMGVDLYLTLPNIVDFTVASTRNLISDDWGEHFVEARFRLGQVILRPYFQQFQYDDYFSDKDNSSNPFRFLAGTDEEMSIYATDLTSSGNSDWEFGAKAKYYDYSSLNDNSNYLSALLIWHGDELTQIGGEVGAMNGDRPQNEYFIYRLYAYLGNSTESIFLPKSISADLVFVDYERQIQNEDSSLFASISGGWHLIENALELKLSGDYSSDPFFDDDYRGMMVLTYKFRSGDK